MTAKIKLNAASGGGSFSIQAPSSSSNNRVIALPDIADGTLLTSQSSLDSTKLSPSITAGITHASTWYLTSGFTGTVNPVTNLSTYTSANAGTLGAAMSISSGAFTFPTTGIWYIELDVGFNLDGDSRYNKGMIVTTSDNFSGTSTAQSAYCFIDDEGYSGTGYSMMHTSHLFDCQDTSTHKVRIGIETQNSSTAIWMMNVKFIRYGDT